jgi:hypothetical protein
LIATIEMPFRDVTGISEAEKQIAGRRQPASCEGDIMRYALLWLLGVPIPLLIVVYLLFH